MQQDVTPAHSINHVIVQYGLYRLLIYTYIIYTYKRSPKVHCTNPNSWPTLTHLCHKLIDTHP